MQHCHGAVELHTAGPNIWTHSNHTVFMRDVGKIIGTVSTELHNASSPPDPKSILLSIQKYGNYNGLVGLYLWPRMAIVHSTTSVMPHPTRIVGTTTTGTGGIVIPCVQKYFMLFVSRRLPRKYFVLLESLLNFSAAARPSCEKVLVAVHLGKFQPDPAKIEHLEHSRL
ncbi:hypothetical protein EI94DRAFT_1728052 [Lactarius quietus]|nr:hypothetical protein EI94DRAFT_1728052 [Lactarius quietus]